MYAFPEAQPVYWWGCGRCVLYYISCSQRLSQCTGRAAAHNKNLVIITIIFGFNPNVTMASAPPAGSRVYKLFEAHLNQLMASAPPAE